MSQGDSERTPLLGNANEAKIEYESTVKSFHILTIFNFLLTIVLWLIEAQDIGFFKDNIPTTDLFNIRKSLLDLVIVSFLRAIALLLAYSVVRVKSRYAVWFTTLLNTLYVIIKVIYFEFTSSRLTDIILGVAVFILAWVELLYYETKVITTRRRADCADVLSQSHSTLSHGVYRHPPGRGYPVYSTPSVVSTASSDQFQTPHDSPTGSLVALDDALDDGHYPVVEEEPEADLSNEHRQLVLLGQRTLQTVWTWYSQPSVDTWVEERITPQVQIYTMDVRGVRTMRIKATLPFSAAQVFRVCFFDNHLMDEWDATVKESRLLETITDHTRIVYNLANELGGGVISSRDFVSLLHWERFDDAWVSCGIACTHQDVPPQPNIVRGENGVCGFVCKPSLSNHAHCEFVWYLTTDLKGWLPKSVIQRSLASVQVLFVEKLEQRLASMASLQ